MPDSVCVCGEGANLYVHKYFRTLLLSVSKFSGFQPGKIYRLVLPWILFIEIVWALCSATCDALSHTHAHDYVHISLRFHSPVDLCNGHSVFFFLFFLLCVPFLTSNPFCEVAHFQARLLLVSCAAALVAYFVCLFSAISKIKVGNKNVSAHFFGQRKIIVKKKKTWKCTCENEKKKKIRLFFSSALFFSFPFISNQNANWLSTNITACFMLSTFITFSSILPSFVSGFM